MRLRRQERALWQRHDRPVQVVRPRDRLDERLRRARDERQLDVLPILTDRVVHDRPALEQRLARAGRRRQHEPVRRFPDRDFAHIAHEQIALAGAGGRDREPPDVLIADRRDGGQVPPDFLVEIGLGDANGHARVEGDRLHVAGVGHEGKRVNRRGTAVDPALEALHAEQAADYARAGRPHFESGAAKRGQKLRARRLLAERQAQRAQPPIERRIRVVAHAGHTASAQIERRERFQDVVELAAGEGDRHLLVAANLAEVLEIPHPALVQHHAPHGQPVGGSRLPHRARRRSLRMNQTRHHERDRHREHDRETHGEPPQMLATFSCHDPTSRSF